MGLEGEGRAPSEFLWEFSPLIKICGVAEHPGAVQQE